MSSRRIPFDFDGPSWHRGRELTRKLKVHFSQITYLFRSTHGSNRLGPVGSYRALKGSMGHIGFAEASVQLGRPMLGASPSAPSGTCADLLRACMLSPEKLELESRKVFRDACAGARAPTRPQIPLNRVLPWLISV